MYRIISNYVVIAEHRLGLFFNKYKFSFKESISKKVRSINYSVSAEKCEPFILVRNLIKVLPMCLTKSDIRPKILYSAILTFLGLEKEAEIEESELITIIKRGILCIQNGQFDKAEHMLHAALQLAHKEMNEDGITYIYDQLANLAFDTGQNSKAEKLFISVMQRLLNDGVQPNDDKIIHITLKLANIYENMKDYKKAELGYNYCINHLEEKSNINDEQNKDTLQLWILSLDAYGRFLVNQSKPDEALKNFKKAYEMSVEVNGNEHKETVLLLNDLGTVLNMLGDLDSAITYIENAVNSAKHMDQIENLSSIYINLGLLYLSKEMYKKSHWACYEGLTLAKREQDEETVNKGRECLKKLYAISKENIK